MSYSLIVAFCAGGLFDLEYNKQFHMPAINFKSFPKQTLLIFKICIFAFAIIILIYYSYKNVLVLDDLNEPYNSAINNQDYVVLASTDQGNSIEYNIPAKGYHIHINLDNYTMYVYKNGQLVKTYPVSGGKPSTPSPLGTWRIIAKDTWGEGFGGAWLAFNVPWGKYGIHGTVYPWFIGKSNSSKGCIRMLNKDVKELYKLIPHGTTVTIVHKNPVFRVLKNGHVGSDVLAVQKALKKLGYYKGYPDGKFGNALAVSVRKFQKDHKLYVSGYVNKKTFDLIMQKANEKEQQEQQNLEPLE